MLNFGPLLSAPLAGNPGTFPVSVAINAVAPRPHAALAVTFGRSAAILGVAPRPHGAFAVTVTSGPSAAILGTTARPRAAFTVSSQIAAHIFGTTARPVGVAHAQFGTGVSISANTHAPSARFVVMQGIGVSVNARTTEPKSAIFVSRAMTAAISGHTGQDTALFRAYQGAGARIVATTRAPTATGAANAYALGAALQGTALRPIGSWSAWAANPIPGIGATLAYLTRLATELPGVMPGPPLLKGLRGGSIEARTLDFTPDLAPIGDGIISINSITVSRVDGSYMTPNDLSITPPFYIPPWLTGSMLSGGNIVGAAIVGWWETASATVALADPIWYKISVTVTTALGSTITRDCYQVVTDAFGGL